MMSYGEAQKLWVDTMRLRHYTPLRLTREIIESKDNPYYSNGAVRLFTGSIVYYDEACKSYIIVQQYGVRYGVPFYILERV